MPAELLRLGVVVVLLCACHPDPDAIPLAGSSAEGIVFVRSANQRGGDLWRARVVDGALLPLRVTSERDEDWPRWSPAGELLVFESGEPGSERRSLLLLDPRTGAERALSPAPNEHQHWAAWSPLGTRVVFAYASPQIRGALAWVDVASGARTSLEPPPAGEFYTRPEFSPGGREVAAERVRREGKGRPVRSIWLLASDAAPRALTLGENNDDSSPRFVRDGQHLVFTRRHRESGDSEIARLSLTGGEPEPLAVSPANERGARASPTRDEVVFVSSRDGADDLFLLDLESGALRNLTQTPERIEAGARWSPDGERILFSVSTPIAQLARRRGERMVVNRAEAEADAQVAVIDRRGQRLLELPGRSPDWMPAWP